MKQKSNRIIRIFIRHSVPMIIVILLLGGGATVLSWNFIHQNAIITANQKLEAVRSYYDVILDEMDSLSLMFSSSPDIMTRLSRILDEEGSIDLDSYREVRLIRSFLSASSNARSYIHNIYVYHEQMKDLVLSSDMAFIPIAQISDSSWYETYKAFDALTQIHSERVVLKAGAPTEQTIIRIMRPIINASGGLSGVIVLDIKEQSLSRAYPFQQGEVLEVHSANNDLLFTSSSRSYDAYNLEYFYNSSEKYGWKYSLGMDRGQLYQLSRTLMYYTIALTVGSLLLGFLLTKRTNRQEHKFLANVINQLGEVTDTESIEGEAQEYHNIFDYLNHHVIKTFLEKDYLAWQKEAMEYRALQMQINPHFLFNTLNTINWKAIKLTEGENDVSRMILLLSKLLKYSLQVNDFVGVTLAEELEQTNHYIQLQKIRFPNQFEYREEIDPIMYESQVPSLFIQPILENAFDHGFIEGQLLVITLTAWMDGEFLRFEIENDGQSLSEEQLHNLNIPPKDVLVREQSLGLMNVMKRLSLFSQGKASLRVMHGKRGGVCVALRIPKS